MSRLLPVLVAMAAFVLPVPGGEPTHVGFWSGAIELPGQKLQIMVDISKRGETWSVVFYAPVQGIRGAEMTGVMVSGRSVSFRIPLTPGEPTFHGELSDDGETVAGSFTQADQTMPFSLARTERPSELDIDIYAEYRAPGVAGEGLEGTWRGLLASGLHRMRLELTVWKNEDGELAGAIDSLDQQALALQVDGIQVTSGTVWFPMAMLGAEFEGKLEADGSEFTGTWRQYGREIPLTFKRAPADWSIRRP